MHLIPAPATSTPRHSYKPHLVGTMSLTLNHSWPLQKSLAFTSRLKRPWKAMCKKRFLPVNLCSLVFSRPLRSKAKDSQPHCRISYCHCELS